MGEDQFRPRSCISVSPLRCRSVPFRSVRLYISERQTDGASNAGINRELAALHRMFTLTVRAGKLTSRPFIEKLAEDNARQGFLDHGSFLALHNALRVTYLV